MVSYKIVVFLWICVAHIVLIKFQVSHGENHHDDGVCAQNAVSCMQAQGDTRRLKDKGKLGK